MDAETPDPKDSIHTAIDAMFAYESTGKGPLRESRRESILSAARRFAHDVVDQWPTNHYGQTTYIRNYLDNLKTLTDPITQ